MMKVTIMPPTIGSTSRPEAVGVAPCTVWR